MLRSNIFSVSTIINKQNQLITDQTLISYINNTSGHIIYITAKPIIITLKTTSIIKITKEIVNTQFKKDYNSDCKIEDLSKSKHPIFTTYSKPEHSDNFNPILEFLERIFCASDSLIMYST